MGQLDSEKLLISCLEGFIKDGESQKTEPDFWVRCNLLIARLTLEMVQANNNKEQDSGQGKA